MTALDTTKIFDQYTQYFVKDFAKNVHKHIASTNPISEQFLESFITDKAANLLQTEKISGKPVITDNTKFIYECVEYVQEKNIRDPLSLEAWNYVSSLPSQYHESIAKDVFTSALLYTKTLDQTLFGLVARDTDNTVKLIRTKLANYHQQTQSGGNLHIFNWGLLDDGLWLNAALMKAYDKTGAFRPGSPVAAYYTSVCYDYALAAVYSPISDEDSNQIESIITTLMASADADITESFEEVSSKVELHRLLRYISDLGQWVEFWKSGFRNSENLVSSIGMLSSMIRVLRGLKNISMAMGEETIVPPSVETRFDELLDILTLCLVGYEALREVHFNDTLILSAAIDNGLIDVYVNADVIKSFYDAGHTADDLMKLGMYAAENKTSAPSSGWTLSWALSRRDTIVSDIMATESDRRDLANATYVGVARGIIIDELSNMVSAYLELRSIDTISESAMEKINDISRSAVGLESSAVSFDLNEAVFGLLISSTGNDFVSGMANKLINNLSNENPEIKKHARILTIMETALETMVDHIYTEPVLEDQ